MEGGGVLGNAKPQPFWLKQRQSLQLRARHLRGLCNCESRVVSPLVGSTGAETPVFETINSLCNCVSQLRNGFADGFSAREGQAFPLTATRNSAGSVQFGFDPRSLGPRIEDYLRL